MKLSVCVLVSVLVVCVSAKDLASQDVSIPTSTDDRLLSPGWWPRKGTEPREAYVGAATCATCHTSIVDIQSTTPMAGASMPANPKTFAKSGITSSLTFNAGAYAYEISQSGTSSIYTASGGMHSVSTPLQWIFGIGHFGQTYLYEQDGTYYESNLSYYPAIQGLDFTTGHSRFAPPSLDKALGEPQTPEAIHACFGCHTTAASTDNRFDASQSMPGVTCEACHGPGAEHVATMTMAGDSQTGSFAFNPVSLRPSDSVDFCGACHRTRLDAIQTGIRGPITTRFPAYRLQESRCWGTDGDARITCIACHDPHRPLVSVSASYDKNCLSCHRSSTTEAYSADHPGAVCPVAQKDCVSCHMPKVNVPEMHAGFTDHRIAIHKEGEPFRE